MTSLKPQPGDIFTNYPDASLNAAAFARAFKASKYTSLKEFLLANQDLSLGRFTMPKTAECGFTDPTHGAVQPLPDQVEWYGGQMIHDGPCEIWCDDEIVLLFTANCRVTYPEGKFPYEKSKCVGKSRLTMFWMATLLEWQVYIDCAKIGEGGPAASSSIARTAATTAPNATTAKTEKMTAMTATTEKPTATTATPWTTTQPAHSGSVGAKASHTGSNSPRCNRK